MWAMTAASTTTAPTPPHAGRRLELVIAAQRVVGAGGLRALTHRAVDADAGLPEGSCSSYYRTKVALLGALTEHIGHQLRVSVLDLGGRLDVVHARHPDGQERSGNECSRGRADGLVAALEGILLGGLTHAAGDGPARAERAAYLTDAVLLVLTPLA